MSVSHQRWTGCSMCETYPTRSLQRRCKSAFTELLLAFNASLKVWHLREIWRYSTDQGGQYPWDQGNSFRHLWGHFWCQKCLRPPLRIQCVQQVYRIRGYTWIQLLCTGILWSSTTRQAKLLRSWTPKRRRRICRRWRRNTTWTLLLVNPPWSHMYLV